MIGPAPGRAGERGSASVELAMLIVPIFFLVAFAVFVGRYASAHQEVTSASRDAARAASVRRLPGHAIADGTAAAEATLRARPVTCPHPVVDVDVGELHPGGRVTAEVTCVVTLADLTGLGVPGRIRIGATSTAVVDTFQGGDPP